jgi:hypothetical protein
MVSFVCPACQRSAADIQRQLPTEAKLFSQVDKQFKDIMRRTKERPNAMQARMDEWIIW